MVRNAIGIDFGTNYCRNAYLEGGRPLLIPNDLREWVTPAWVRCSANGDKIVGWDSKPAHYSPNEIPLTQIKSRLAGQDGVWSGKRMHAPAEIASWIFEALRRDAEGVLGQPVTGAVVAMPASASHLQRASTQQAIKLAGLTTIRLISEPTAAVIGHHMLSGQSNRRTLVYSLGAGYFEMAVIENTDQTFKTLCTEADKQIGGNAFDRQIRDYVLNQFLEQYGVNLSTNSPLLWRLADLIEVAKIELSTEYETYIPVDESASMAPVANSLYAYGYGYPNLESQVSPSGALSLSKGHTRHLMLKRSELEELLNESIEDTLGLVHQALYGAKLTINDIDDILLVGGSTEIPLVQDRLLDEFDKELVLASDDIIALGAALQTADLETGEDDTTTSPPLTPVSQYPPNTRGGTLYSPSIEGIGGQFKVLPPSPSELGRIEGAQAVSGELVGEPAPPQDESHSTPEEAFEAVESVSPTTLRQAQGTADEENEETGHVAQMLPEWREVPQILQRLYLTLCLNLGNYFLNKYLRATLEQAEELLQANQSDDVFTLLKPLHKNIQNLLAEKHFIKGRELLERGDLSYGIQELETALTYNPHHDHSLSQISHFYQSYAEQLCDKREGKALLDLIQRIQDYRIDGNWTRYRLAGYYFYAKSLASEGKWREAIEYFEKTRQFYPEDEKIQQELAECYMKIGQRLFNEGKIKMALVYFKFGQIHHPQDQTINECIRYLQRRAT